MADDSSGATIEALGAETRTFPPPDDFADQALVADRSLHEEAEQDRVAFWERQARELLDWREPWTEGLQWNLPYAEWFVGGKLNMTENCLDRHVEAGRGDKVAYHWEGEPGDTRTFTYAELLSQVNRCANALAEMGVTKGDRVCFYMPMIPELPIAMLACARIGAPHSVVFGGFSASALADRINDAEAKVLITADAGYRRGEPSTLKPAARRRPRRHVDHRARHRRQPLRHEPGHDRRSRRLVARGDGGSERRVPRRGDGQRGPAVPAVHLGHDRQAQGHHAHDRRLPDPGRVHPTGTCSTSTPTPTCTGAPPTSAG